MRSCVYAVASDWRITGSSVTPIARAVARSCAQLPPTRPVCASVERSRSKPRVVSATRHPSPTSPRRIESGTRTSLKNTSLNDAPPLIWRIGRTSIPGRSIGMMNAVRPLCFTASGSVRAMSSPHSENRAPELQTFCPLTTHSSPSRAARQARPPRSDPAPGSENSWQQSSSRAEEALDELPALGVVAERHDRRGDQPRRDAVRLVAGRAARSWLSSSANARAYSTGSPSPPNSFGAETAWYPRSAFSCVQRLDPREQRPLVGPRTGHGTRRR